ncbi:MAG TPA: HD domain-containing phosphohydrolase [Thermoanaerobaculia bacterium]|nr:HD domain-containing phosphohydrolase [Thermoanaerobaculia bacterium]
MEELIVHIAAAVNIWTLYPSNHPRVARAVELIVDSVARVLLSSGRDAVTFLIVGEDVVADDEVMRKSTLSHLQFIGSLKRRGVERLTLAAGVDPAETAAFVAALATGANLESSQHVIFGRVDVNLEDENRDRKEETHELRPEQLNVVREAFAQFRSDQKLPLGAIEQLIWGFIDSLSKTTRSVLPLARLKEHDEYTFVHSVNVSLLVLGQARSFGIQGPMLHAFGTAALLHDIGKLMVPISVLNHPGKLEGEQWATMQNHAAEGASYLGEIAGSSELASLVAYEHHLRYDMQPSYPVLKRPRRPNLVSRMTSIADCYDAMSTVRPYQKPMMRSAALEMLQKRSETFYDPLLVANFVRLVRDSGATAA